MYKEKKSEFCPQTAVKNHSKLLGRGKKSKIKINLPAQGLNRFANGFVEHVQVVCRYPNEPTMMPNESQ